MSFFDKTKRPLTSLVLAATLGLAIPSTGCFHRGRHNPLGWIGAAIVTAAVISAVSPPPPQVVIVPAQRPGYVWQEGYWTRDGDRWVWIEGRWIQLPPNYTWAPTHWEQAPDGTWHLIPGRWIPTR